ncbi:sugar/nucleoside kinase (ribokinase family) [Hamadaea flava]|uniref:Adenosine kinase n=1 Tax=Hamadaea flava TaxID=1742688 RepID=A0ABV8LMS3_9ACTN|nr:adenosine kinase [Hamadaea flava]MCP2324501.1 sugar/nucleoside kinase (ribokinase family) [Hamadaea flava]
MTDYDVLVLGGAGVDTIVYVPELPLPYADSYMVPAIQARPGQTGDFVALGLHALGLRTHHLDVLGADREGDLVRDLHERHGVGFTVVPTAAGTKRAVNLVDPVGRRLSLYDVSRGDADDRFPEDLVAKLAGVSRHAHVSITHPGAQALPAIVASGATISTDLHNWDGENPYHLGFAEHADVVFVSAAALADHESAMRELLSRGRARAVIATAGSAGAFLLTRDSQRVRHQPALVPPAPVVDSNGAGDAFVTGFLFGLLDGADWDTCLRYGAVAGAFACTIPSTRMEFVSRDDLLASA